MLIHRPLSRKSVYVKQYSQFIRLLAFSLSSIMLLTSCTKEEAISPGYENVARAKAYIERGHLSAARIELLNALQADAGSADGYFMLAELFTMLGAHEKAVLQYEKGVGLTDSPTSEHTLKLLRLRAMSSISSSDDLLANIENIAVANKELTVEKLLITALIQLREPQKHTEAENLYQQVLALDANSAEAHYGLARIAASTKNFGLASTHLEKALVASPGYTDALLLGGKLALEENRNIDAERLFTTSLSSQQQYDTMTPNKYLTLAGLINALNRQGKHKQALTYAGILSKSRPGQLKSSFQGALTALSGKDYAKAQSELDAALKLAPSHAPSNYVMGMMKLKQGDIEAAEEHLSHALDGKYIPEKTRIALVITRLKLKQFEKAKKLIQLGLSESPENPIYHALEGNLLLLTEQLPPAEASFKKALQYQKKFIPALTGLAKFYEKQGKVLQAKAQMKKMINAAPNNIQVLASYMNFAMRNKDPEWGVSGIEALREMSPELIAPPMVLASYHYQQKDFRLTQKYIDEAEVIDANNPLLKSLSSNLHFVKAVEAAKKQDNKSAIDHLNHAIASQPSHLKPYILKAGLLAKDGQTDDAIAVAKILQSKDKTKLVGVELEGKVWAQLAQFTKAEAAYSEIWRTVKNNKVAVSLYRIKKQTTDNDTAMLHVRDWAKDEPESIAALTTFAILQQENKHNKEAIKLYEKALNLKNDNPLILNNLAYLYFEEKDSRALQLAAQAYSIAPKSAAIADTYGWILIENNQLRKGLPILQQAAEAAPKSKEILQHYSEALTRAGKLDEAAAVIEQITKL